jgi:predicted transcriptional regulator
MSSMKDSAEERKSERVVDPVIEAYKKGVDLTLIRENLRLTVDQRFQQLMKLQQFAEDLRRAGRKARSQK